MFVFRLAKEKYIHDLSGAGARLYGGRWNQKGTPMLYTSEYCSLALLELIVHTPHNLLPDNMSLLKLFVPDTVSISILEQNQLPHNWQQYPAPNSLAERGTQWMNDCEFAAIKVPSVVVPDEWNILLNPEHNDFNEISINRISAFRLDSRF